MVSYVLGVQNKLSKMAAPAEHRREAQVDQKRWYDHNARQREFQTGGMVMVLTAELKGPYPILQKIRSANYMVDMRGRECTFHVNMLKRRTLPQRMFTLQQKGRKEKKHKRRIFLNGEEGEVENQKWVSSCQILRMSRHGSCLMSFRKP